MRRQQRPLAGLVSVNRDGSHHRDSGEGGGPAHSNPATLARRTQVNPRAQCKAPSRDRSSRSRQGRAEGVEGDRRAPDRLRAPRSGADSVAKNYRWSGPEGLKKQTLARGTNTRFAKKKPTASIPAHPGRGPRPLRTCGRGSVAIALPARRRAGAGSPRSRGQYRGHRRIRVAERSGRPV